MTKPLSSQELVRLSWLTELRRQGHRQCTGVGARSGGMVCALKLLSEVAGTRSWFSRETSEAAGLTNGQAVRVIRMNDGSENHRRHTFAEIADVVEGWFKK